MELQKRKHPRLKKFDYSTTGVYFITICTKVREPILCNIFTANPVGRDDLGTPQDHEISPYIVQLTKFGKITEKYINSIPQGYENVSVDKYVIMPDHIHMLLSLVKDNRRAESSRPTDISQIIGAMKRLINKEIGENIFQTSFYDHIIRDEDDYLIKWNYIENNPAKWFERVGDTQ